MRNFFTNRYVLGVLAVFVLFAAFPLYEAWLFETTQRILNFFGQLIKAIMPILIIILVAGWLFKKVFGGGNKKGGGHG